MHTDKELRGIEEFFHEKIPLSKAMHVRVERYDGTHLALSAPLAQNHNHLGTAFGGGLAAMATLAGYGLLWLRLGDREAHVVIASSKMKFLRPVSGDLHAVCEAPSESALASFAKKFTRHGKAKIALSVKITEHGKTAVEFEGKFVAVKD